MSKNESNNTLSLSRADLNRPIKDIYEEVMRRDGRVGLPRVFYKDQFDSFKMRLEGSNLGYSVSCFLNGSCSYQLNAQNFAGSTPIGSVMLIAASAPADATIDSFFTV